MVRLQSSTRLVFASWLLVWLACFPLGGHTDRCARLASEAESPIVAFDFPGFSSSSPVVLIASARIQPNNASSRLLCTENADDSANGGFVELTGSSSSTVGSQGAAWFSSPVWGERFVCEFTFSMNGPEGLAFVMKAAEASSLNSTTPEAAPQEFIGPDAGGLGYGSTQTEGQQLGILASLAIELDAHQNTELLDPNGNHISVHSRGSALSNSASELYTLGWVSSLNFSDSSYFPLLSDGQIHSASLVYDLSDTSLLIAIDDRPVLALRDLDLFSLLLGAPDSGAGLLWLGFTAANQQAGVQLSHAVHSWQYRYLGRVDASLCSAEGPGLEGGQAGPQQVLISTFDEFGHPITEADAVVFKVELSRVVADSTAVFLGNGLWNLTYLASSAGNAVLTISVASDRNGSFAPLPDGPWIIGIEAGPMIPTRSIATGQGTQTALVNLDNVLELQLYDAFDNPVLTASATNISGYLLNQPNVLISSAYTNQGLYRLTYQPYHQGPTLLFIFVDGQPIVNSPFAVDVIESQFDVQNTVVSGPGLSAASCGRAAYFFIELRDQANNTVDAVAKVHVKVEQTICKDCSPVQVLELKTLVVPFGLGIYEATYSAVLPKRTVITVRINDEKLSRTFEFRADPGFVDAEKSTATGNGLLFHVPNNNNNQFFVQPRDRLSNPIKTDSVQLVVRIFHKNTSYPAQTHFVPSRGLYEVLYEAGKDDDVEIDVAVLEKKTGALTMIHGSPFKVKPQGDQWLTAFLFGSLFFLLLFAGVLILLIYYPRMGGRK